MMLARASCPDRAVQTRALNRVTMADLMASEGGDKRSTRMLNRGGANASNQAGNRSTRMLGAQELASAGIPSGANRPGDRGTRMLGASDVARAGMSFCPVAFGRQGWVWDRDCLDMGIEQMGCRMRTVDRVFILCTRRSRHRKSRRRPWDAHARRGRPGERR